MSSTPDTVSPSQRYFDLGTFTRRVTTSSPAAQTWFDRGLIWSSSFHHEEAARCFSLALAHDETCVMAYWGLAYALGGNYNKSWEGFAPGEIERNLSRTRNALDSAGEHEGSATEVELALVGAVRARLPEDLTSRDYKAWDEAYAHAMRAVYHRFPDDLDVAALYAESMMNLTPWQLWDLRSGAPAPNSRAAEIRSVLEHAMTTQPEAVMEHPAILHFYIHLMEMSAHPELALPAADRLTHLVPDAGHMNHMGSHIYFLVGDYQRAMASNRLAVESDAKWRSLRPGAQGFYDFYTLHNLHFLVYSAMFAGRYAESLKYSQMIEDQLSEDTLETYGHIFEFVYPTKIMVYVRFGRWDEIKRIDLSDKYARRELYPLTIAWTHWGKAIAHSAMADIPSAEKERQLYLSALDSIPEKQLVFPSRHDAVTAVSTSMLDGELEYRRGNYDQAFSHLRDAIDKYDGLDYSEPWCWMTPVRHAYAALKLERGEVEEALQVYGDDLGLGGRLPRAHQHPNNIWALCGYHECLLRLGREEEARDVEGALAKARWEADTDVDRSCACRLSMRV